jgi:pyruvate dehydrogenase phosphatase
MPTTTAPFVLATAALAAGGSIGYYLASLQDGSTQTLTTTTFDGKHAEYRPRASGQVFDIVVPSQPVVKSTHAKLTSAEIEAFLKANETSIPVRDRPGNPILRWDTNIVPANPVCEDRITIDLVGKDDIDELIHASTPFWPRWREIRTKALSIVGPWQKILPQVSPGAGDKDVSFFSVFDGHGGISTVDHISKVLHPTLARALGRSTLREQDASALTDVIQKTYVTTQYHFLTVDTLHSMTTCNRRL